MPRRALLAVVVLGMVLVAACGGGGSSDGAGSGGGGSKVTPNSASPAGPKPKQTNVVTLVPAGAAFAAGTLAKDRWLVSGDHVESLVAGKGAAIAAAKAPGHGLSGVVRQASDQLGLAVRVKDEKNMWFLTPLPHFGGWRVAEMSDGKVVKNWGVRLVGSAAGTQAALISKGDTLVVVIGGRVRLTFTDPDFADQTKVGVVSFSPVTGGWTKLAVQP